MTVQIEFAREQDEQRPVKLPIYGTEESGWMDLHAYIPKAESEFGDVILPPGTRYAFRTGLFSRIPKGWRVEFGPRSGLALKKGLDIMAGKIDSDYRDEWKVILINLGREDVLIRHGERICQFKAEEAPRIEIVERTLEYLGKTSRTGGFGSTGS